MKLYGNRFIKKSLRDLMETKVETRNAVICSVETLLRRAKVKIQGSDQDIYAYYPENWEQTPPWLKPRNAVIISHPGGTRGRIELIGHGQLRPTIVGLPDIATPADAILSGLAVIQIPYGDWMRVMVTTGTARFDGITYTRDAVEMDLSGDPFLMSMGGFMGQIADVKIIDTAPAVGYFRYDLIVIGPDLVIDYVKGANFTVTESMPDVPSGHLKCGHILLYGGMAAIKQADIDASWITLAPAYLAMTIADDDLAWAELSTTVTVAVTDQYGNPIYDVAPGWYFILTIASGNGTVSIGSESSTTSVGAFTGAASNQCIFTYTRDQLDPGDISPTLVATVDGYIALDVTKTIILRDASGYPML